MSAIMMYK